jgi:hypothetical protein
MLVYVADDRVVLRGGIPVARGVRRSGGLVGFADGGVGYDGRQHAGEGGAHRHDPTVGAMQTLDRGVAPLA